MTSGVEGAAERDTAANPIENGDYVASTIVALCITPTTLLLDLRNIYGV